MTGCPFTKQHAERVLARTAKNADLGKRFFKELDNWPLEGNEHLNLVYVETFGHDMEDFLSNAMITLEDWHGNEGPDWELGDLHDRDYARVVALFAEYLAGGE